MQTGTLAEKILMLKKTRDAVLLVHNYQRPEIQDMADYLGDSLDLSRKAAGTDHSVIVFCGVMFMAETAKILSPDKTVLIPQQDAGCPMARMADVSSLKKLKAVHPRAKVVTYVNSTAEVKAESDVCCTSANAVEVVQNVDGDEIIFTPDKNLASWVARFTNKTIIPWDGYCYVHDQFTVEEVKQARDNHPGALILVHPECPPGVADAADAVCSTSGMLKTALETEAKTIVVGTEEGMIYRLKKAVPEKHFLSLGTAKMCRGMKLTRPEDVHRSLADLQYPIKISSDIMDRARAALMRMLHHA